jgi:hypothetical protein
VKQRKGYELRPPFRLVQLLSRNGKRYPADVLIEVLFDFARQGSCEVELRKALEKSVKLKQ